MITPPVDFDSRSRLSARLVLALLILTLGFGVYLFFSGRTKDFGEFIVDRREGAGQTQPDVAAECSYQIEEDQNLVVARKAHGQKSVQQLALADKYVEAHYGAQHVLVETASTADTFNCINGEILSHELVATKGDPIARVLFSESGRHVAIVLNREGQADGIAVFKFQTDKGASRWNIGPADPGAGINGPIRDVALVGESLVAVLEVEGQTQVHTYNFRRSHEKIPWNSHSAEQKPFAPNGVLVVDPVVDERGRMATVTLREKNNEVKYSYDFTCRLEPPEGETENPKPCVWARVE